MTTPDWARDLETLLRSPDATVVRTGNVLADVFRKAALRPPDDVLDRREAIGATVRTQFPTQFAEGFERWTGASQQLSEALRHGDPDAVSKAFRGAFDELYDLWKRVINFLPFLLMISVNRLKPDVVKQHAGKELAAAITLYHEFYEAADERQKESDQRKLVEQLLALFRRLDAEGVLGRELVFQPILGEVGGFAGLFPVRFEAQLLVIQQIRNRVQHAELDKRPPAILEPLYRFLVASFLDVVSTLSPICAHYALVFFMETRPGTAGDTVRGLAFSGVGPPAAVEFLLPPPGKDADKIQPGQLYLVRRGRENPGPGAAAALDPDEYLDLTPFLIYERKRLSAMLAAQAGSPGATESRLLFVFRRYLERAKSLSYLEFAGREELAIRSAGREFENLVDEIQLFAKNLDRLRDPAADVRSAQDRVFTVTWDVSTDHLATVTNAAEYEAHGAHTPGEGAGAGRTAFSEALFVAPAESAPITAFLASKKRGLVITGDSGIGKSNLLCHFFLEERRAGRPALFLSGRHFHEPDLHAFLEEDVAARIDRSWKLRELDAFFEQRQEPLTIFLDAVNEYSGPGGPQRLLEKLLQFVQDEQLFPHVRLAFTCRSEVWDQHRNPDGTKEGPPLPPTFFTQDALRLEGFDDEKRREALFAAYQGQYTLRPRRYRQLAPSVQTLIRHPFMMSLIAETYSNRPAGGTGEAGGKTIPRDLDYFEIFKALTARKLDDARWLDPRRDGLPGEMEECLFKFARLLWRTLTQAPAAAGPASLAAGPAGRETDKLGDALRWNELQRDPDFGPIFTADPGEDHISAFQAAVQIGLLQKQVVPEIGYSGTTRFGRVFRFFHDQYSQFWLAAVYHAETLGAIQGRTLGHPQLMRLAQAVTELIHRSTRAPILAGAIDHWLHRNMTLPLKTAADLQLPLLNLLSESDSGAVRYYVRTFLTNVMLRGIATPETLYRLVFQDGTRAMCVGLAEAFGEGGASLPPEALRVFMDVCSPERADEVIGRLSDVFAHRFAEAPGETLAYLDKVMNVLTSAGALARVKTMPRQIDFMLRFSTLVVLSAFDRAPDLAALGSFAQRKYGLVINAVAKSRGPSLIERGPLGQAARLLYGAFENLGVAQWRRHIGAMALSGNDRLFVENDGIVQRDVVYEFFPYACAFHNGDVATLSLEPGSPFRDLVLRMLGYRVTSLIGYFAVVLLPVLLRRRWDTVEPVIDDLMALNTASGRFFGSLLLVNVSYTEPGLAEGCLDLLRRKVLPWMLSGGHELAWPVLDGLGIAAGNVASLWPSCERALNLVFDDYERRADERATTEFGGELVKASFFPDRRLGIRLLATMLDRGCLAHPLWRPCTLTVMAGALARSPSGFHEFVEQRGLDDAVEREARRFLTEPLSAARDVHLSQVYWNRFIANAMAFDVKLRYLILKHLVGGLAQSNSVEDYAKAFRRFVVDLVAAYLGNGGDEQQYLHLSPEEALADAESRRVVGGGKIWQERPAP